SLLIRSKNPRRCQAENPLKLLSEFAGPALSFHTQLPAPVVDRLKEYERQRRRIEQSHPAILTYPRLARRGTCCSNAGICFAIASAKLCLFGHP
ncbi:hypothetical protein, partial [Bradyrhizobium liaoningense]|uniref:hypothetical protein n=1 Tax=Bradyrhizobium liaoningense TaxID=43992 RepID=UPI001BA9C092